MSKYTGDAVRVFIAEDEVLIRMLLLDMVEEAGCEITGVAATIEDAERQAQSVEADVALLDVTLFDKDIFPAAEAFGRRGIPIIFCTGYAKSDLPAEWAGCGVLRKPYTQDRLVAALRNLPRSTQHESSHRD
jgi:DNA-binding response OmpR family regulator